MPNPLSSDQLAAALQPVAKDPSGYKVIFPFGAKIVDFEGEKVLCPMTLDEYQQAVQRDFGSERAEHLEKGWCPWTNKGCRSSGCTTYCDGPFYGEGGFYCLCS